jgi:uncharacterized protein (UPF0333 family)
MKRGQSSFEYILLVGTILIILIPLFYYSTNLITENIKVSQAGDVVNTLAKASDEVYVLGPGTKKFVWVTIPGSVKSTNLALSEITLTITSFGKDSDITATTSASLVGSIPTDKGTYKIPVEHLDSGIVQIGISNDTAEPSITWVSPTTLACNPVTLRVTTNEPANCKFDTSDNNYETMAFSFSGSSLGHNYEVGVQDQSNYTYYARCSDGFGNTMTSSSQIAYSINFTYCNAGQNGTVTAESDPPLVSLTNPSNGFISNTSTNSMFYNVTDASPLLLCQVISNHTIMETVFTPEVNSINNISVAWEQGYHNWSVNCTDSFGNIGSSQEWNILVNATKDSDIPIINLIGPANSSLRNFNLVNFFYNVTDTTSDITSCSISILSELDSGSTSGQAITDFSVSENIQESLSITLDKGNHTWNVSCKDSSEFSNIGYSESRYIRINSTTEEAFITSCPGRCGFDGFSNGVCRQSTSKCTQNGEVHSSEGDDYCTGGAQSDTCCCVI